MTVTNAVRGLPQERGAEPAECECNTNGSAPYNTDAPKERRDEQ